MGIKKVICAIIFLITAVKGFSLSSDSLSVKNKPAPVKIGPVYFDASIDSALLRRLLVKERLQKKNEDAPELENYQNLLVLRNLLNETEISEEPSDRIIGSLELVLEEYQRTKNLKGQALIYNTYGVYYGRKGETEKAISNFLEALKIREQLKDKFGMARVGDNLAALYRMKGNYGQAAGYNEISIRHYAALGKTAEAATTYLALAENKLLQKKYSESENCVLRKALPMFTRTGNKAGRLKSFQSLARIYYQQDKLTEAKWFYVQAQSLAQRLNNQEAVISSLIHLAEVKNALGEFEWALDDYLEAERLAIKNNMPYKLLEIKGDLGEIYNQMGNYLAAGNALDEYNRLKEDFLKDIVL